MVRNASRKSPYISKSIAKAIQQDFLDMISLEDIRDPLEINKSNREPVFNSPYSTGSFFFQVQTQAMRSGCSYHSVMHLNSNSVEKLKLWVNNLKL